MSVDEPAHVRVVDTNHDRARVAGIIGFAGRRHRPVVRSLPRLRARRPHRGLRPRHARRPAHSHCQRRRAQTPRRSSSQHAAPPTRSRHRPEERAGTTCSLTIPALPSASPASVTVTRHHPPSPQRSSSPSPSIHRLPICPSHSWRLSMPGHRRLQLLQSPRVCPQWPCPRPSRPLTVYSVPLY